VDVTQR